MPGLPDRRRCMMASVVYLVVGVIFLMFVAFSFVATDQNTDR